MKRIPAVGYVFKDAMNICPQIIVKENQQKKNISWLNSIKRDIVVHGYEILFIPNPN